MTVAGNGVVSVRRRGDTRTFAAGESLGPRRAVRDAPRRAVRVAGAGASRWRQPRPRRRRRRPATSLRDEADRAREAFEAALGRRDVDGCVAAVLGLEEAIAAWQADTLQSDDADEARRVLRAMVVRLGELAEQGAADPADAVAPFVEALLAVRTGRAGEQGLRDLGPGPGPAGRGRRRGARHPRRHLLEPLRLTRLRISLATAKPSAHGVRVFGMQLSRAQQPSFDHLVAVSHRRLLRQLTVMTADLEQAQDCLQEAYERAWARWPSVSRLEDPEAWIRKVAWRVAVEQPSATR